VDSDMGPDTVIGVAKDEACAMGVLAPEYAGNGPWYGAGFGIYFGPSGDGGLPAPVQLPGQSVTLQLSNVPSAGARLVVLVDGMQYCYPIQDTLTTIPWTMFNTLCYGDPADGAYLGGAPATPYINLSILSVQDMTTQESFDFCIEQLTFNP
jgi:hypothetical protein